MSSTQLHEEFAKSIAYFQAESVKLQITYSYTN